MTASTVLEELKGRDVVLFVADKDEISPSEVPFPVVFTGMGKMRMFSALVKWREAGYIVISMKNDFKTIYGPGVQKVDFTF